MPKNKKGLLTTRKLSPESYVKTQARTLPVVDCLVSANWESNGICSVFVARGHKTGNVTLGIYLVDIYCLGLKDTTYRFNISPQELGHLIKRGNMEKCDYVLAHNIIYGAIEFAGDYGFNPHKDFAVTRFILEEDDEQVELMEVEFGMDGIPCYFRGPHDTDARVKSIGATLETTAGPGNYTIIDTDGDFGIDEDLDDEFWEDDEDPLTVMFKKVSEKYDELIVPAGAPDTFNDLRIGMDYEVTGEPIESEYVNFDSAGEKDAYIELYKMLAEKKKLNRAIKELNEAIVTYPGKAVFYNLLQSAYMLNGEKDKSREILDEMRRQFPGYLYAKIAYANLMIEEGRPDEAITAFNGARDLHEVYPARDVFHESEAAAFWGTMCNYFVIIGDVDMADAYMNAILKHELHYLPNQNVLHIALTGLCQLKIDRLKESGLFDFE